ncbi:hypothetical protein OG402_11900 [Streptomyces anulatus]|uniref:hypothetical protein n=1 Tax=Streptomyces anulatus TaxID=1892 RepID=UPI0022563EA4|nr:hypothetical protein [Streptomyces anulatus]MCX4601191.1 hypothetical protein [Streptomyces anulatus]
MTTTPEETHMPTDPNHRALLRAIDGLTTQVRRIADTLETPVTTDDDGAQTADDDTPVTRGAEKQRTIRRQQFRILLNQLNDGTTPLSPTQVQALTAYVADEIVECNMETKEADRLEGDVKLLRAELDRIYTRRAPGGEGYVSLTIDEQIAMGAKLEEATTTLRRVRHLHARTTIQTATGGPVDVCATCESDAMSHPWPCPTTEALAGPTTDR